MKRLYGFRVAALAALLATPTMGASVDEPVFALAKMRNSPVVDGVIGADEWKDATKALQFIPRLGNVAFPGEAQVLFGRDAEKFYVAARMIVSPHGLGNIMETGWRELRESPAAKAFAAGKCSRHLSRIAQMDFYDRIREVCSNIS